jgi:predicted RNase H-like HicB family nuclease
MTKYTIIIESGEGNFSAYAPDLPGVVAAGETEEETIKLMEEAIDYPSHSRPYPLEVLKLLSKLALPC